MDPRSRAYGLHWRFGEGKFVGSFWMAFTLSLSQKKYLKIKEME
jgi:hypothetical protein